MVKAPTPEEEDRRRLCRERKVLIGERVQHVNRVKGLLFSQGISGYEPLRRDRRERLDTPCWCEPRTQRSLVIDEVPSLRASNARLRHSAAKGTSIKEESALRARRRVPRCRILV